MNAINKLRFNLNIIASHTIGVIYALIKGKRIISLSKAYIEYFENYLFSPDGVNYNLEYTLPLYGKHSFDNWVKSNNYHIKLSRSVNLGCKQRLSLFKKYLDILNNLRDKFRLFVFKNSIGMLNCFLTKVKNKSVFFK